MTDESSKLPEILGRLRESVKAEDSTNAKVEPVPEAVQRYAPASIRREKKEITNLQRIGEYVNKLTYREAMAMGRQIASKIKDDGKATEVALTAAIQDWAFEWETFEDEQRPGSKD